MVDDNQLALGVGIEEDGLDGFALFGLKRINAKHSAGTAAEVIRDVGVGDNAVVVACAPASINAIAFSGEIDGNELLQFASLFGSRLLRGRVCGDGNELDATKDDRCEPRSADSGGVDHVPRDVDVEGGGMVPDSRIFVFFGGCGV